jgi:eukaryotic-like serine/threonine-protein kinase
MSDAADSRADAGSNDTSIEAELGRVLESYLADLEAGRPADPERLIALHPAIAEQLRSCLAVVQLADRVVDGSGVLPAGGRAGAHGDTTAATTTRSGFSTLGFGDGSSASVRLRDLPDEREPLVNPRSDEIPTAAGALGRYQLQGEIARGGMGAILKGLDVDLGRELAIKVLLEIHRDNPDVIQRFVEEAQIGGQLQHPGIVPVFELGTVPDRRPYFAMKLVKGRTLAALLRERADDQADRPRFLAIFEQICQTMAYAHARGVIHRDLKPSNVMVGSFGEVQVMDWGLAKVLPEGGVADEVGSKSDRETIVTTVRSGSTGSGSESQAGSVLGTPSYMAPEQARGEVDKIDERADVFGLGAILCEMLTGRPPFAGLTREEIRAQSGRGELANAIVQLEGTGVDGDLIALAQDCLAAERDRRPRNAGEVAHRVTAYLAGVQARLKMAELARVEVQARAEEAQARAWIERSRRQRTVALAASVLVIAALVGGGWAHLTRQRQERVGRFNRALGEAEAFFDEAKRAGADLARWLTARDAAHALGGLLADAADEGTRIRVSAMVRDVAQAAAAAENDQKLLARLVDIRAARADDDDDDDDGAATDAEYAHAFGEAGIEVAAITPAEASANFQARPAAVTVALAAALDDWAALRRHVRGDEAGALRLTEAARLADPDPWRGRLRDLLQSPAGQDRLTSLKELARSARIEELPAASVHLLGATLFNMGDFTTGSAVLREGQRLYPRDFWLNYGLARCLVRLARRGEAIRYYMAARSLRPEMAHRLGHTLENNGETDQAIAVFQDSARLRPEDSMPLNCLGVVLQSRGRNAEAKAAFEAAVAASRTAIGLKRNTARAHGNLGLALRHLGKLDEAVAECRKSLRLKPDNAKAHNFLGMALSDQGKLDEAVAEYREAVRLKPDLTVAHNNLAQALHEQGKLQEATAEYREALRLEPDYAVFHSNLGSALRAQGMLQEAISEYREAVRLKPDFAFAHRDIGVALLDEAKLHEAIAEFREALRLKPDCAEARDGLGIVLSEQGKLEEAIAEHREALRLKADYFDAHGNLGNALLRQGKPDEAVVEYREALRLKPHDPRAHQSLGIALYTQGKLDEAIAEHRTALRFKPEFAEAHHMIGIALRDEKKLDAASAEFRIALRLKPNYAEAHFGLGHVLSDQGKLDEAIAEYRTVLRLEPAYPEAHYGLGNAYRDQRNLDAAVIEYREALRLQPDSPEARCNLGQVLLQQGHFAEALAELKRGHELGSRSPNWRYPSAQWVHRAERMVELEEKLPALLKGDGKTADAGESATLAQMCYDKKLHGGAARMWEDSFKAQPALAEDLKVQNRYNAACAAALAGCGQGTDKPPLTEEDKVHWRRQAIEWLRADLAAWSKVVASGPAQGREAAVKTLQHWKADADLVSRQSSIDG